jgi:chromosomal replication initiation ATPase DnaA
MKQGTFDLSVEPQYHRADFLVSDSNRAAFALIEGWPDWPLRAAVLHGPAGSGKTHLAHLWCARSGALLVAGEALARPEELTPSVAVDNAERADERLLLHLYNLALERGGSLLLTMPAPPARLAIGLADLASRLRSLPVVGIAPPDDGLLTAVLAKHFADRQLRVVPEVLAYLVARIERSFAAAADTVARLDQLGLETRRPVTIKLAREVLGAEDGLEGRTASASSSQSGGSR